MDYEGAFARYHGPLFRYLHRLTGDSDMAEDIAQESFVRLFGRPVAEEKVRAWLFTVATNLVRDSARTRARRKRLLSAEVVAPDMPARPDEQLERDEAVGAVRRALDQLAPRDRQLLLLREEGFRYQEIGELVGVAPGSVGKLLTRALQRFAELYGTPDSSGTGSENDKGDDVDHEGRGEADASYS